MSNSRDNSENKKENTTSHSGDDSAMSSETNKKKAKIPKFEEKDMYRIKYDF